MAYVVYNDGDGFIAMGVTMVLEGVTLNKAAELLYDTEVTRAERRSSPLSYLKSLEDFAFGLIFADKIAAGRVAPVTEGVEPFRLLSGDFAVSIEQIEQGPPAESVLADEGQRAHVLKLIQALDEAVQRDGDAWRQHALREVRGLGNHRSLYQDLNDPSEYVFEGRYNFWPSRDLQDSVPPRYIEEMLTTVRFSPVIPHGVKEKALREYLSRNVLAHLLIFRSYQLGIGAKYGPGEALHLPHATRASLLPPTSSQTWMVQKFQMPRLVLRILDLAKDRGEFRRCLFEYASGNSLIRHSRLFAEVVAYQAAGRTREAAESARYLNSLCISEPYPDAIRSGGIATGRQGTPSLFAAHQGVLSEQYQRELSRVFSELQEGALPSEVQPINRSVWSREPRSSDHGREPMGVVTADRWDVFVCHASEDKTEVIDPLAEELKRLGLRVWYDRWAIRIGDSLRRRIDEGLSRSDFGIVVLSPSFLQKDWPQRELDGLAQREIGARKVILPVWHEVDRAQILRFSPMLADRVAANTSHGIARLAAELYGAIRPDTEHRVMLEQKGREVVGLQEVSPTTLPSRDGRLERQPGDDTSGSVEPAIYESHELMKVPTPLPYLVLLLVFLVLEWQWSRLPLLLWAIAAGGVWLVLRECNLTAVRYRVLVPFPLIVRALGLARRVPFELTVDAAVKFEVRGLWMRWLACRARCPKCGPAGDASFVYPYCKKGKIGGCCERLPFTHHFTFNPLTMLGEPCTPPEELRMLD